MSQLKFMPNYASVQILVALLISFAISGLAVFYVKQILWFFGGLGFGAVAITLSWQLAKLFKFFYDLLMGNVETADKTVLITGVSSGFGMALAIQLDKLGFSVIGTARVTDDERARTLRSLCSERLRLIKLDVTKDEEVALAVYQVDKMLDGRPLWALVNNAGVASLHGVEWGAPGVELFKRTIDVNTLGVVRVCRAFVPMLRKISGSRCVIVTSVESRSEPLNQPSYAMSKYATRAFANALRRELKSRNVHVSVIEPGFYATGATDERRLLTDLDINWKGTPAVRRDELGGDLHFEQFSAFTKAAFLLKHADLSPVVEAMTSAVAQRAQPKYYYRVLGLTESLILWFVELLPEEVTDILLNSTVMVFSFKVLKYIVNGPLYL